MAAVEGRDIARNSNPNRRMLEDKLAALEGGQLLFFSGQPATMSIFHSLGTGSRLSSDDIYYGTAYCWKSCTPPGNIVASVDMTDINNIAAAIQPNTRLIWIKALPIP
jgi:O-acetylhomoserine/O-acetylserine sulfhydrylase-like pyridoxal-dependent enzyme